MSTSCYRNEIAIIWSRRDMGWPCDSAKRNVLTTMTGTVTMTWGRMGWLMIGLSFSAAACGSRRGRTGPGRCLATGLACPVGSISAKCDVSANVRLKPVSARERSPSMRALMKGICIVLGAEQHLIRAMSVTRSRC